MFWALLVSSCCRCKASGSSRSLSWLEKVKALCAVASAAGVVRGDAGGGEKALGELEAEVREGAGEGNPELLGDRPRDTSGVWILLGRLCW